jgi:hypothetical protein
MLDVNQRREVDHTYISAELRGRIGIRHMPKALISLTAPRWILPTLYNDNKESLCAYLPQCIFSGHFNC